MPFSFTDHEEVIMRLYGKAGKWRMKVSYFFTCDLIIQIINSPLATIDVAGYIYIFSTIPRISKSKFWSNVKYNLRWEPKGYMIICGLY